MVTDDIENGGTSKLKAENDRLRAENGRLRWQVQAVTGGDSPVDSHGHWLRTLGAVVFAVLAVVVLVAGNLLFWTGNTIVNNDRFTAAASPVIRDKTVQKALANYTTAQIYKNVDVTSFVQDTLPPRAEFLAPTLSGELRGFTQDTLQKVLANPEFQTKWNDVQSRAHNRFITTVKKSGGNGVIDLNDLYQQLAGSLRDTKLSFLADKQLPAKVGDIQVAQGSGIQLLHNVVVHIDTWRVLALVLFVVSAGLAILLAQRRRRMVVQLGLYCAGGMLVTLVALRVAREVIAGKVDAQYAQAARNAAQIVLHPLVLQTVAILLLFALVALVAWLTGHGRSASYVQNRLQLLLAGKLHHAIFGEHENAFTRWVGRHKLALKWAVVIVAVIVLLSVRLTPKVIGLYALLVALLVAVIELLAAPSRESRVHNS